MIGTHSLAYLIHFSHLWWNIFTEENEYLVPYQATEYPFPQLLLFCCCFGLFFSFVRSYMLGKPNEYRDSLNSENSQNTNRASKQHVKLTHLKVSDLASLPFENLTYEEFPINFLKKVFD